METQIQQGYYVWAPPGKPLEVHLHIDIVERLMSEVMRGFGAVRKRGVEVGGLLIGTVREGSPTIVKIDDFELVPCEYRRGPSYLLGETDGAAFDEAYERLRPSVISPRYAVGFFRSHTRDGMSLAEEDVGLMDDCFPEPSYVALLIKPAGTKASTAGFFFREEGVFQSETPLEFPFRRHELTGEDPPPRRSLSERRRSSFENMATGSNAASTGSWGSTFPGGLNGPTGSYGSNGPYEGTGQYGAFPLNRDPAQGDRALERTMPGSALAYPSDNLPALREKPPMRGGWVWMPLSFVFLLLGLMLGFQIALSLGSRSAANGAAQDYSLLLSVSKNGDNLLVRWNTEAPLVRAADRGELEIEDRGLTKSVPLDRANLQNGSITVQRASSSVRFRLTVYPHGKVAASEAVDWKQ